MNRQGNWRSGLGVLLVVLTGCAGVPADPQVEKQRRESIDDILNQPLEQAEYGTPQRCISEFAFRDFQALNDRYLVVEGPGDQLWLNELRGLCPELHRSAALAFRQRSMRICAFDQFKVVDWLARPYDERGSWHRLDGFPCTLGEFQPVSPAQLEALRAALGP
jgi:hypothetical protein